MRVNILCDKFLIFAAINISKTQVNAGYGKIIAKETELKPSLHAQAGILKLSDLLGVSIEIAPFLKETDL